MCSMKISVAPGLAVERRGSKSLGSSDRKVSMSAQQSQGGVAVLLRQQFRPEAITEKKPMLAPALTILLSSFLLFLMQPILAKQILPWFGGSPGVWTICLMFFQLVLLLGYAYAHWITRLREPRQVTFHILLLVVSCLTL